MPLYDYKCDSCNNEFEAFNKLESYKTFPCPKCQGHSTLIIAKANKDWFPVGGFWHEHLDSKPIHVTSKSHYRKLCKERGWTARCLL